MNETFSKAVELGESNGRMPAVAYRADIDGLRAIAVIAVVAFHAFPSSLPGGFVGVDVFFVISGFLISTIIFRGLEQGTFSFLDFYGRRIRRIFPALMTVLAVTYAFGWVALNPDEFRMLGKHIAAGAGFVSNFVLQRESGYFDSSANTKPLLHLWSLGIEEQFYLGFPLLVWACWRRRWKLSIPIAAVALISFAINLLKYRANPAFGYYSPLTRGWELMVGAALAHFSLHGSAYLPTSSEAWRRRSKEIQSFAGLALVALSLIVIDKETAFPGWWALLPTVGAALLIAAGPDAWFNRQVLSRRLLVAIGMISFPLYLWHWVLLSFPFIMNEGEPSVGTRFAAVALCGVLAWVTYRVVERPLRHGGNLQMKALALFGVAVMALAVGLATYWSPGIASLQARSLPPLALAFHQQRAWDANRTPECVKRFGSEFDQYCQIDDASKDPELILIGDSNGNHLIEGLRRVVPDGHVLMLGRGACPPLLGVTARIAEGERDCAPTMSKALDIAASMPSVRTVVLSMMGPGYVNGRRSLVTGGFIDMRSVDSSPSAREQVFADGLRRTLDFLARTGKDVIFVVSTPRLDFSPAACVDERPLRISPKPLKSPCAMARSTFEQDSGDYRRLVFAVLREYPAVKVFDTAAVLCDEDSCHAMKDDHLLYRDDVHLSIAGSEYIARRIVDAFPLR